MKNLFFVVCVLPLFVCCKPKAPLSTAAVPTVQTDSVKAPYTHIKKGMEQAFVDFLFPDLDVYVGEELEQYREHKKKILAAYKSGEQVIDIDPVTPEGNYYLNYSGFSKAAIINVNEVKQFLE
jgi:hypothetical protein